MNFNGMYQPMGMPAYPMAQPMNGYAQPDTMRQPYQQIGQAPANQMMNMQAAPQTDPGMIWVQGEAGAKAYMVAPGNNVVLWDSEANVIYLKSADTSGMPYMRVFDYSERSAAPRNVSQANTNQYVTRDEFNALAAKFEQLTKPAAGKEEDANAE